MYGFVHFSSLMISGKFWKLLYRFIKGLFVEKDEKEESAGAELLRILRRKLIAVVRSGMFFVCFQHFSKLIQCYWRHYVLRADPIWSTLGCIYIATLLAELFETPQRRIQYTLYISTQLMRMMANAVNLKYGKIIEGDARLRWIYEWWSVIMFQLTFAIWCYIKALKKSDRYCGQWSLSTMNTIM